ncbi:arginase family protein [Micromonospora sp. DH14]|uniref:arginase family protein n=1 Tax=Micromonospora sp. DH14 TaxID=3040120 RepID=UPI0024432636|nr:arginase family protein [Micromonospora sp. DH14]MDG9677681.1 arginase family protein [Micromonospora sp. DH14]
MMRRIAVLDAPTNLGLRPPTPTSVPGCAKAPGALRDHDLLARLRARDAGCVTPARYDPGDWRPGDGVCHAREIADYSLALAERIGSIIDRGEFPVVLGGDCSVLLGSALAMHRLGEAVGGRIGLVFVDGHSDFRHPGNASYVGAAAGEDLALVTGRGQADLAALEGRRPYFRDIDVVVLGIRAQDEYRLDLQAAGITTRPVPALRAEGAARTAQWAHEQLADCAGYWVHIDVDVLDPAVMPAVDAPDPGGIAFAELEILLAGLVDTPHCLGVELTVFDPDYDPDGSYAAEIVNTVVAGLAPVTAPEAVPPRLLSARPTPSPRRGNGRAATATERAERLDGLAGGLAGLERVAGRDRAESFDGPPGVLGGAAPPVGVEVADGGASGDDGGGGGPPGGDRAGGGPSGPGSSGVRSPGDGSTGVGSADGGIPGGPSVSAVPDDVAAEAQSPGTLGPAHSEPSGIAARIAPLVEREPVGPPASAGPGLLRRPSPPADNPADRHKADTA